MTLDRRPALLSSARQTVAAEFLSTKEAARLLGIHYNTLCKWRIRGGGPRFVRVGAAVRYKRSELETWLDNRTYSNTTEYEGR
jgi:excisionase family DNA binding protein